MYSKTVHIAIFVVVTVVVIISIIIIVLLNQSSKKRNLQYAIETRAQQRTVADNLLNQHLNSSSSSSEQPINTEIKPQEQEKTNVTEEPKKCPYSKQIVNTSSSQI